MFWPIFTVSGAVVIFAVVFSLFPWGRETRNPEKNDWRMFLSSGGGA